MNQKLKIFVITLMVLFIFAISFNLLYYNKVQLKNKTPNTEEELRKIAEENVGKVNFVENKVTPTDLENMKRESGEEFSTYEENQERYKKELKEMEKMGGRYSNAVIINNSMDKLTEEDKEFYEQQIFNLISMYEFKEASILSNRITSKYNLFDHPDFAVLLADINSGAFIETYAMESDKIALATQIADPIYGTYVFFSLSKEAQNEMILRQDSIVINSQYASPQLISIDKVSPRNYNLDREFIDLNDLEVYKLKFKIEEGEIDVIYAYSDYKYKGQVVEIYSTDSGIQSYQTYKDLFGERKKY